MHHGRSPHDLRGWLHVRMPRRSPPTGGHVRRGLRGAQRSRTAMDEGNGLHVSTRQELKTQEMAERKAAKEFSDQRFPNLIPDIQKTEEVKNKPLELEPRPNNPNQYLFSLSTGKPHIFSTRPMIRLLKQMLLQLTLSWISGEYGGEGSVESIKNRRYSWLPKPYATDKELTMAQE